VLVGIEVILIGLLAVSGNLLRERAHALREATDVLQAEAAPPRTGSAVQLARAVVDTRTARIDWAQVLDDVSASIPDNVTLTKIAGGVAYDNGVPGMDLEGRVANASELEPVLSFVESLRTAPRLAVVLPGVDLETVEAERNRGFKVVCRAAPAQEAS
jgi:hypothetical protein